MREPTKSEAVGEGRRTGSRAGHCVAGALPAAGGQTAPRARLFHHGLLALLAASCQLDPAPPPAMVRLGDASEARPLRFEDQTRPVLRFASGEKRAFRVHVEPGSKLRFAVAMLEDGAPATGFVHLSVTVGDREVFQDRFSVKRSGHWFSRSVTLQESGRVELGFRVQHGRAGGAPFPSPPDDPDRAFVALAMPRLYAASPPARDRRVLVWVSQDALRADHLGSYGYARPTSPRFDARAAGWIVFDEASASAPWTLPSMASQLFSQHPSSHGALLPELLPREGLVSVFEALAEDGFTVIGVTANDLISPGHTLAGGFDVLHYREQRAEQLSELLLRTLDECEGGDLALFIHVMDPHSPYVPPGAFRYLFHAEHEGPEPPTHFSELEKIQDPDAVAHVVALYDAEIAYADAAIGGLLDDLEARGLLENAVIAYTADHGEALGEHGDWLHGGSLYEEQIHVPFALRIPGAAPARIPTPVSLVDLAPTLLESLGIDAPASFEGRSLLPLLESGGRVRGRSALAETSLTLDKRPLVSDRDGPHKVILTLSPRSDEVEVESRQLFHLGRDPGELDDIWGDPRGAELASRAIELVRRARAGSGPPRPASLSPEAIRKLRAFGYIQ